MCYKKNVKFSTMGDKETTLILIAHFSKYDVHKKQLSHIHNTSLSCVQSFTVHTAQDLVLKGNTKD